MSTCATLSPIARVSTDRLSRFQGGWMTGGNSAPSIPAIATSPRFPRWLVAIGLGVPLVLIAVAASPLGNDFFYVVIGIPALLLTWAMAGVGAIVVSVRCAMRKEWRRSAIALALPVVLLVVALDPIRFVRSCNHIGDVVHFVIDKPSYDRAVAALPAGDGSRLAVFDWVAWRGPRPASSTMRATRWLCRRVANPPTGWRGRATAN
jgi:hypothetical protein